MEANNIPYDLCTFMNFLDAVYLKNENNEELLEGRWFGHTNSQRGIDGAIGRFYLRKVNASTDIDVDKYFPQLAKMIRRFNK